MAELSVNAVLAVVARELPGASVVAFDDRAQVVAMAGPDAEKLRRAMPAAVRASARGRGALDRRLAGGGRRTPADRHRAGPRRGRTCGRRCLSDAPHQRRRSTARGARAAAPPARPRARRDHRARPALAARSPTGTGRREEMYGYSGEQAHGQVTHDVARDRVSRAPGGGRRRPACERTLGRASLVTSAATGLRSSCPRARLWCATRTAARWRSSS